MKEFKLNLIQLILIIFGVVIITSLTIIEIVKYCSDTDTMLEEYSKEITVSEDVYKNYSGEEAGFSWYLKNVSSSDSLKHKYLLYTGGTYQIKDGKLYAFGDKNAYIIDIHIDGNVKYVFMARDTYALTEEGTLWVHKDGEKIDYFKKMDFDKKVVDICGSNHGFGEKYKQLFYLLEDGSLIDKDGKSYESYDHGFVDAIYLNDGTNVYLKEDNTAYVYDFKKDNDTYIQITDSNGENVMIKEYFFASEELYFVSSDNKLYYIDDEIAREPKDTKGKIVKNIESTNIEFGDTEAIETTFTFDDDTNKVIRSK